jgi:hypothetical protein
MFCEAMDEPPDHTGPLMNLEDFSFDDCGVLEASFSNLSITAEGYP